MCKIADFGLSNDTVAGEMLKTVCGTPAFAAPEVRLCPYSNYKPH